MMLVLIGLLTIHNSVSAVYYYDEWTTNGQLMTPGGLAAARAAIGQQATVAGEEYQGANEWWNLAGKYPNLQCIEPGNGADWKAADYSSFKVQGVIDLNPTGYNPNQGTLYYSNTGTSTRIDENGTAAKMAYTYYCASQAGTGLGTAQDWNNNFLSTNGMFRGYVQNFGVGDYSALQGYAQQTGGNGGSVNGNADKYAEFALALSQSEDPTKAVKGNTEKQIKQTEDGYVDGIEFTQAVTDKGEYDESSPSTEFEITAKAKLQDGSEVDVTVEGVDDLKDLQAGSYRVNVPGSTVPKTAEDTDANPTATITFHIKYNLFRGRAVIMYAPDGKMQARILTGGEMVKVEYDIVFKIGVDEIEPEEEEEPREDDVPLIRLIKVDQDEARLDGVTLKVVIDDPNGIETNLFVTDPSKEYDLELWIGRDLLDYQGGGQFGSNADQTLLGFLDDVKKNNASKFFDTKYQCGESKSRIEYDDEHVKPYIESEVLKKLLPKLKTTPTWQQWQSWIDQCAAKNHKSKLIGSYTDQKTGKTTYYYTHSDKCVEATKNMAEATAAAEKFAKDYPNSTDMLKEWLENMKFTPSKYVSMFGKLPTSEIGDIDFKYSAKKFFQESGCADYELTVSDLARILTADIQIDVTEVATKDGYIPWMNKSTKTIIIKYDGGDIKGVEYKDDENDKVELDYEAEDSEDGTYQITKVIAYNQIKDTEVFELTKYMWLSGDEIPMDNVVFTLKASAKETYDNGSSRVIDYTFNLTTDSSGKVKLTAEDYINLGIDVISRWTGEITFELTEISTHDRYILWQGSKKIIVNYNEGSASISSQEETNDGEDAFEAKASGVKVEVEAWNAPKSQPQIVIQKVDASGSALEGAVFDITIEGNGNTVSLSGVETNDAGEIVIYSTDLEGLQIDVLTRWSGTLNITLQETKAPEGFKLIEEAINVTVTYSGTSGLTGASGGGDKVTVETHKNSYTDNEGHEAECLVAAIIIENEQEGKLLLRKVDGETDTQEGLTGAEFRVSVNGYGVRGSVDENGYLDLTENAPGINLGSYTGTLTVTIEETRAPSGYHGLPSEKTVYLEYDNGLLTGINYGGDDEAETYIDVSLSEDGLTVVIAVKNFEGKDITPVYLKKVEKDSGVTLSNVDFSVIISKNEINSTADDRIDMDRTTYKTDDDGIFAITAEKLASIGIEKGYTGDLYVLIKELGAKEGYQPLEDEIYLRITYDNGTITETTVIKGNIDMTLVDNILTMTVENVRQMPDFVITKETLSNGVTENLSNVTLTIAIQGGKTVTERVGSDGRIVIPGEELGIEESYSGDVKVTITENSVSENGAVKIPEPIQITLKFENGKCVEVVEINNPVHASVVIRDMEVNIKVLDSKEPDENAVLAGYVWEELATTKGANTLIDGLYTTPSNDLDKYDPSASEYSDRRFEGIIVTLLNSDGSFASEVEGANPVVTDSQGYFEFKVPVGGKYIVRFTYNGQVFEPSPHAQVDPYRDFDTYKISSKASELQSDRQRVNNMLQEIGSYPLNYRGGQYGNTIAYRYDELKEVSNAIEDEIREEINTRENGKISDGELVSIYQRAASRVKDDPEVMNKIAYILDTRVNAYAGYSTQAGGIGSATGVQTWPYAGTQSKMYEESRYINLGLVKRDMTDLTLSKDIVDTMVSINKKDEKYDLEQGAGKYDQYIYQEDYDYSLNPNSDGIAFYQDDKIDVYVKYKITVRNTTGTPTRLREVVDYFDNKFSYASGYKTTTGAELKGLEVKKVGANGAEQDITATANRASVYGESSQIGITGNVPYNELYILFNNDNNALLQDGQRIDIYITVKLGKLDSSRDVMDNSSISSPYGGGRTAQEILQECIRDNKTLIMQNYAEVNGYWTNEGFLDMDSKPGTFVVKDYEDEKKTYTELYPTRRTSSKEAFADSLKRIEEIREDDAWNVELDISNLLTEEDSGEYYHRHLRGNVWEAVNDEVRTSADLYNRDRLLTYLANNNLSGIIVELVEYENENTQVVRARTITDGNGYYEIKNYIAGDYAVRFVYGSNGEDKYTDTDGTYIYNDDQRNSIKSTATVTKERNGYKTYGVNGQYYQSTKANPNTDVLKYWYAKYNGNDYIASTKENFDKENAAETQNKERYSDAYDEVNARIRQIEAKTAGTEDGVLSGDKAKVDNSWSWNYEWDGVYNNQVAGDAKHLDRMEAYTSTLVVEIEYTQTEVEGNREHEFYRYEVNDVDFGLTPRADANLTIDKTVSNIKIYLQDGTLQLDADIYPDGTVRFTNDATYQNIVLPRTNNAYYLDDLIEVLFDEQLLNGATLEATYTITVTNNGQSNTITYFYNGEDLYHPIALAYYYGDANGESLQNIVYYESDRGDNNPVVTHDTPNEKYAVQSCNTDKTKITDVRTRATNIVDFVDPNMTFTQKNHAGQDINLDWELTEPSQYNSTREAYNGYYGFNNWIRAVGGKSWSSYLDYLNEYPNGHTTANEAGESNLYTPLLPGETATTTLTLSKVLETSSTLTNDYEYGNFIEITKLENYAGKVLKLNGYDITGETNPETSDPTPEIPNMDVPDRPNPFDPENPPERHIPTIGTSKSETINIHAPTGLSESDEIVVNTWIVLLGLVILAGGIFGIKKFVLTPKN